MKIEIQTPDTRLSAISSCNTNGTTLPSIRFKKGPPIVLPEFLLVEGHEAHNMPEGQPIRDKLHGHDAIYQMLISIGKIRTLAALLPGR